MAAATNTARDTDRDRVALLDPMSDEWVEHAIRLAEAKQLTGTARFIETASTAEHLVFRVPSASRDATYTVHYFRRLGTVRCGYHDGLEGCERSVFSSGLGPCCHAGAAWHAVRQMLRGEGEQGVEEQARYERFCEDLETRGF